MKKSKILLICILSACTLIGCSKEDDSSKTKNTIEDTDIKSIMTAISTTRLEADVPVDKDYNKYEFKFLVREVDGNGYWGSKEIYSEEENGDPINDAVFRRNKIIEDRYNIKITEIRDYSMLPLVQKVVNAGDHVYDCVMPSVNEAASLANAGYLLPMNELPYIDLSKPWWDKNSNDLLSIGKNCFFTVGDLNIMDNDATYVLMFNKNVAKDANINNLYDYVKNNEWTFDTFYSTIKIVSQDLNGDGKYSEDDKYGLLSDKGAIKLGLFYASGESLIQKDNENYPMLTTDLSRSSQVMESLMNITNDKANTLLAENISHITDPWTNGLNKIFKEDRGLFYGIGLTVMHKMRDMNSDFGLLPYPKSDKNQSEYVNLVSAWCSNAIAIPVTTPDIEKASIIIEALAAESMYTLTPAYYDTTITNKTMRDEESADMLDIILKNRVYDLGTVYNWNGIGNLPMDTNDAGNFASAFAKKEVATRKAIEKTIEKFNDLK